MGTTRPPGPDLPSFVRGTLDDGSLRSPITGAPDFIADHSRDQCGDPARGAILSTSLGNRPSRLRSRPRHPNSEADPTISTQKPNPTPTQKPTRPSQLGEPTPPSQVEEPTPPPNLREPTCRFRALGRPADSVSRIPAAFRRILRGTIPGNPILGKTTVGQQQAVRPDSPREMADLYPLGWPPCGRFHRCRNSGLAEFIGTRADGASRETFARQTGARQ